MNYTGIILLLLLCALKLGAAEGSGGGAGPGGGAGSELFPIGGQWIYSYHALLRSGTLLPSEAFSQWDLYGKLVVRGLSDGAVAMSLTDLTVSVYNGPRDAIPVRPKLAPLDVETARALGTPFLVHYTGSLSETVSVSAADPLWAVNVKRAVAGVLQLAADKLGDAASLVSEHGVHGECRGIEHSVVNNTEYVYVRKVIDHALCDGSGVAWSSAPPLYCPGVEDDAYSSSTTREYTLARKTDTEKLELRHVMSSRRLYVQPFQASAEAQQVYQYQVYQLESASIDDKTSNMELPANLTRTTLRYEHNLRDLTHGRTRVDQHEATKRARGLLERLARALDGPGARPNARLLHDRLLTQLYYNSFLLDADSLRRLYTDIAIGTSYRLETVRNIFLELLPQIGTADSVRFMRDLITKSRLKDLARLKLLAVFPFYVREPNARTLTDAEPLLQLGDGYDASIRRAAVLAFSTLVQRAWAAGQCPQELLEHYARRFFDLFTESASYGQRMLYLQALDNLQAGPVFNFLSSVVQNAEQSRHARFLAVWASMQTIALRPADAYRLYWPILIDRAQHLEMRVASLTMLLLAQPSRSRLLTLYWYMQGEPDKHLYSMFYTTLRSLRHTTYPCYRPLGKLARQLARFVRPPPTAAHWATGNYLVDYKNADGAFGGMAQLFLVADPLSGGPNIVYLTLSSYATGRSLSQVAVYMKLQGVPERLRSALPVDGRKPVRPDAVDRLIKLLEAADVKLLPPEDVHLELIVKVHGKTVFCDYFDSKGFTDMVNALRHLKMFLEYHMNYQSIFLPYLSEHLEPSDIGTLVLRGIVSNSVASARGNSTAHHENTKANTYNFDLDFRYHTYTTNFLEVYNPALGLWHGAHKSRSLQARFLFNGTLVISAADDGVRLSEQRGGTDYVSLVLHSQSMTYIIGEPGTEKLLNQHCPHCVIDHVVHDGGHKINKQLLELPLEAFGTKLQINLFECEKYDDHKKLMLDVYSSHRGNAEIVPFAEPILFVLHLVDYVTYMLPHRSCGISLYLRPFYNETTELAVSSSLQGVTETAEDAYKEQSATEVEPHRLFTLMHHRLPDGELLQSWNISARAYSAENVARTRVNLNFEHEDASGNNQKMQVELQLSLHGRHDSADSVWPQEATSVGTIELGRGRITWSQGTNLECIVTAGVPEHRRRLAGTADYWPFKQCRESMIPPSKDESKPGNPGFSVPCHLAARELAAYRNYNWTVTFNSMPGWFVNLISTAQKLVGAVKKENTQADNITSLQAALTLSPDVEPLLHVNLGDIDFELGLPAVKFMDDLRLLLQDDWSTNLGFSKMCVVSAQKVRTIDNRTVGIEELRLRGKDTALAADCSSGVPMFAVFLSTSTNAGDLALTVYAGADIVTLRPGPSDALVTLNDVPFTEQGRDGRYVSVRRPRAGLVLVRVHSTTSARLSLLYTRRHALIELRGPFGGRLCGVCAQHRQSSDK